MAVPWSVWEMETPRVLPFHARVRRLSGDAPGASRDGAVTGGASRDGAVHQEAPSGP